MGRASKLRAVSHGERAHRSMEWTEAEKNRARQLLARGVRVAERSQACDLCSTPIGPGDLIGLAPDGWAHLSCLPGSMTQASAKGRRYARRLAARVAKNDTT